MVKHKKEEIFRLGREERKREVAKYFLFRENILSYNVSNVTVKTVSTVDILIIVRIFLVYVELKYCATPNMETLSGVADEGISA